MVKVLMAIYDKQADVYSDVMTFENEKLGVATIRREVRDLYLNEKVNIDTLHDQALLTIGRYDTTSGEIHAEDVEYAEYYNLYGFVLDLEEKEDK